MEDPLLGSAPVPGRSRSVFVGSIFGLVSCVLFVVGSAFFHPSLILVPWCYTTGITLYFVGTVIFVLSAVPGSLKSVRDFLDGRPYERLPRNWCSDAVDVANGVAGITFLAGTALLFPKQSSTVVNLENSLNVAGLGLYVLTMSWATFWAIYTKPRIAPLIAMMVLYWMGMVLFIVSMFMPVPSMSCFGTLMAGSCVFVLGGVINIRIVS